MVAAESLSFFEHFEKVGEIGEYPHCCEIARVGGSLKRRREQSSPQAEQRRPAARKTRNRKDCVKFVNERKGSARLAGLITEAQMR
jgi:hypothetical protein